VSKITLSVDTCWATLSSFAVAKSLDQPTSMRILTPPSSSRRDEDAGEADCAPSNGVKENIVVVVLLSLLRTIAGGYGMGEPSRAKEKRESDLSIAHGHRAVSKSAAGLRGKVRK